MTNLNEQVEVEQTEVNEVVEIDFSKVLKADKFRMIAEQLRDHGAEFWEELADMAVEEADRIEKANARNRGKKVQTRAQKENEVYKEQILEFIGEQDEDYQFTGFMLMEAIEDFEDFSAQKITALLSQLVKEEVVDKVGQIEDGDKRRMGYQLA